MTLNEKFQKATGESPAFDITIEGSGEYRFRAKILNFQVPIIGDLSRSKKEARISAFKKWEANTPDDSGYSVELALYGQPCKNCGTLTVQYNLCGDVDMSLWDGLCDKCEDDFQHEQDLYDAMREAEER